MSAVASSEAFAGVSVSAFPSLCGTPPLRRKVLLEAVPEGIAPEDQVHVLGGGCLRNMVGTDPLPGNWHLHSFEQCFELVASPAFVRELAEKGAYLLTPGWLASWRGRVARWGFDETSAPPFFAESARTLALLDTGVDPEAGAQLEAFSRFTGLPAQRFPVGTDYLHHLLSGIVLGWRLDSERKERRDERREAARRLADSVAALDLIGSFDRVMTEPQTVERFFTLFRSLFAPRRLAYLPIRSGEPGELVRGFGDPARGADSEDVSPEKMLAFPGDHALTEDDGILLRLVFEGEVLGVVLVGSFAVRGSATRYLDLCLTVARVFGLALSNSRAYQALAESRESLRELNGALERKVLERTAKLEAANRDLEAFCYMISHEMRAPIARLEGFCEMLKEGLPRDGESPLSRLAARIQAASLRMREVVDGLLRLTRLSLDDLAVEDVDLSAIATSAVDAYRHDKPALETKVTIAPGVLVRGDRRLLTLCLGQLLENALRFSSGAPHPEVEFGTVPGSIPRTLFVRDNGVGFDGANSSSFFQPFSRMNVSGDLEGAGLGLAMVRKIVERHGGQVRARATRGCGATFYFNVSP